MITLLISAALAIGAYSDNNTPLNNIASPQSSETFVNGRPTDGLALLSDDLSKDMWFSTGTLKSTTSIMQNFDIDFEKDLIYYSQINNKYRLYISWGKPNSTEPAGLMELHYFGHGSNFTLESDGDDRYIWIDNFSSKKQNGEYWTPQIISRVPIRDGEIMKSWEAPDNYYFGESNVTVAVDVPNDKLAVLNYAKGIVTTYNLNELKSLPVEKITLEPIVFGGDLAPEEETTKVFEVMAHDCTKAKPIGQFFTKRDPGISWQGFDISGDYIYQARGNGNKNDGKDASTGWIYIFKTDGSIILPATPMNPLNNLRLLNELGITDTGYMEPEGVKVRRGVMYCGYASKNSENVRRGTILKYSPIQNEKVKLRFSK